MESKSKLESQSARVSHSVSELGTVFAALSMRLSPRQSVNMHGKCLAYTCSHAQRSSRRCCLQNSHVRFIGRLDTGQWDNQTERDKRQSHSEDCYYHIYKAVLVLVDVRGQFVMPTKCYKFAALNLN